ncbi:hypothetical protein NP284_15020 [Rhodopseudomonas pseudopalustris]|nr:hypothetical protein [Rhodopseudomonas pseudopalustris]
MPMTVSAEMWLRFSADNAVVCDNRRKIASTMITVAVDDQAESIAPTTSHKKRDQPELASMLQRTTLATTAGPDRRANGRNLNGGLAESNFCTKCMIPKNTPVSFKQEPRGG